MQRLNICLKKRRLLMIEKTNKKGEISLAFFEIILRRCFLSWTKLSNIYFYL